jgi:hypothetical protein
MAREPAKARRISGTQAGDDGPRTFFPFSVRGPERGFRIEGRIEAAAERPLAGEAN